MQEGGGESRALGKLRPSRRKTVCFQGCSCKLAWGRRAHLEAGACLETPLLPSWYQPASTARVLAAAGGECGVPTVRRYYTPVMDAPSPATAAAGNGGNGGGRSGGDSKALPALCYSFDRGSVHFVMMDSEMPSDPESAQGRRVHEKQKGRRAGGGVYQQDSRCQSECGWQGRWQVAGGRGHGQVGALIRDNNGGGLPKAEESE